MIKIENTEVYGFEAAIRGMRNPLNSWDKSDSYYGCEEVQCIECDVRKDCDRLYPSKSYHIGENDFALMEKLAAAGNDHGKFMRMITVTCDIVAPLYWWKEFDTYKVGTVANSCSTMHKIHAKEFTWDDFSHEHLMTSHSDSFPMYSIFDGRVTSPLGILDTVIVALNLARKKYLKTKNKDYWWQMIQLLPCSYNQRRTVQLNYAVLKNIYNARRAHKLDEWHDFCHWIEELPYSELITGEKENECK